MCRDSVDELPGSRLLLLWWLDRRQRMPAHTKRSRRVRRCLALLLRKLLGDWRGNLPIALLQEGNFLEPLALTGHLALQQTDRCGIFSVWQGVAAQERVKPGLVIFKQLLQRAPLAGQFGGAQHGALRRGLQLFLLCGSWWRRRL